VIPETKPADGPVDVLREAAMRKRSAKRKKARHSLSQNNATTPSQGPSAVPESVSAARVETQPGFSQQAENRIWKLLQRGVLVLTFLYYAFKVNEFLAPYYATLVTVLLALLTTASQAIWVYKWARGKKAGLTHPWQQPFCTLATAVTAACAWYAFHLNEPVQFALGIIYSVSALAWVVVWFISAYERDKLTARMFILYHRVVAASVARNDFFELYLEVLTKAVIDMAEKLNIPRETLFDRDKLAAMKTNVESSQLKNQEHLRDLQRFFQEYA
jgi:hypothetical protein